MELAEMRAITGKTSLKDWAAVGRISVLPFNANTVAIIRSAMAFAIGTDLVNQLETICTDKRQDSKRTHEQVEC